ncbi:hypothetical protein TL16_g13200 [Triparma laevis f. inornata]|uniref:PDEase domain-containing protein n=2 Tax=Triparma laevis TaxID=1534972 RepID=A0A9W7B278_9STRA|nr:hypothetical protein TrLO_g14720 [Triparma laevis f. longispina]GMH95600.1 hypothetical protein TL16_g13200 [Triparma laevis f. inornata]
MLKSASDAKVKSVDLLLGMITAAVHDVGHRGVSNNFLIKFSDPLAITYNDDHVQENFHTAEAFRVAAEAEGCNIFELCSKETYGGEGTKNGLETQDILKGVMMCADIGHGAKQFEVHIKWSMKVVEEFYSQGDREREANTSVSPLCNRCGEKESFYDGQSGFLRYLVEPLFEVMAPR